MSTDVLVPLAPMHKKFADEYLSSQEKKQSAIRAGYSPTSAHVTANKLLKRQDVQEYLASRVTEIAAKTEQLEPVREELSTRVIKEMEALAFANIADFITIDEDGKPQVDFSTATEEQLKAITSIKTKRTKRYDGKGQHIATDEESMFSMADKYRGLELLGKHLGLFKAEEQRVVVDVADRLLNARRRVMLSANEQGGGGSRV